MALATSSDSVRSNPLSFIRRITIDSLYMKKPLQTPNATERLQINREIELEIQQRKGLDFAAFSPMAEFAAVTAGHHLRIFSWDRRDDFSWTPCWSEIVLRECMKASERMVAIALSTSLVAVAAKGGFEVYELNTPETILKKEPVIQETDMSELNTIALSLKIPEISGQICAGTGDGKLLIWDIRRGDDGHYILTAQPPHKLSLGEYDGTTLDISAVAFSHDSSRICVGTTNRYIFIYNLGEDGCSLVMHFRLQGKFVSRVSLHRVAPANKEKGTGIFQFVRFTSMAFLSGDQIAITTDSTFSAGCPAVFDIDIGTLRKTRTAFDDETTEAQSLAVSPSKTCVAFVDSRKHRVMLVRCSPGGNFNGGIAEKTHVTKLEHGAAQSFTRLKLDDGSDGREGFLVMDRMGMIQLFSCNT